MLQMMTEIRGQTTISSGSDSSGRRRSIGTRSLSEDGAHVDQLGEARIVERSLEERHAGRCARARLVADDPFDRLQMTEAPELEALLDIDQLLAHVVRIPPLLRIAVDRLEHGDEIGVARVALRKIAIEARARNRQASPREMTQKLVVERWRAQQFPE